MTGKDFFDRIIELLESLEVDNLTILGNLKDIQHLLSITNSGSDDLSLYNQILSIIKKIGITFDENYIFQVDTVLNASCASLSTDIIEELKTTMTFLNKLTQPQRNDTLRRFQQEFYDRYEDREIPLMHALDDNIARLVPLYHSLGTVRDTLVVPLVTVTGTGTKCVI